MKSVFEYAVIGLGGIGSAAAYWLSRQAGGEVLGLEQFEFGHVRGESQDHSRIIRLSYHKPEYVELARQAYAAWDVLQDESGDELVIRTGGLDLWPPNAYIPMDDYCSSLVACNIPFEVLKTSEIRYRYPQFELEEGTTGLFQAEGGIAAAAKGNAAHQRLARHHGAILKQNSPVFAVRKHESSWEITAQDGTYTCGKLIIAGGPWSNQILSNFGMKLPLTVTQEQVSYFVPSDLNKFQRDRFPIWIWMDEPSFYGFPVYGEEAIKIGQDVGGKEVTADTRTYVPDQDAFERTRKFLCKYIPGGAGPLLYTKTCLYTLTPDRDFVIDALPEHNNCFITIGAGHAYKFSSAIGKILSEMAIDGKTRSNIDLFRVDRPVLKEENPPKSWLI